MEAKQRAARLAALLLEDCTQLLHLYTERESLSPTPPVAGGQLVKLPPLDALSSAERLCFLHAALSECRLLLDEAIKREDEQFVLQGDEYKTQRGTVKDRLGHLLLSTERLLEDSKRCAASVAEIPDSLDSGTFAVKFWILQVLQDLVHWSKQTSRTLQAMSTETEKKPRSRRARRELRRHQGRQRK
ncbi:ciliary neurotrophic factor [Hoplias malabaricus]|uniref:ciliary neurotrophic factor n=1 Tax=Hoplias malabaricus TaxID=27720 RepID=UPI003462632B